VELGKMLNVSSANARAAMRKGLEAQQGFEKAMQDKGREILSKVGANEKLFVLISRPYNGCDEGVSLQLPKKFSEAGVDSTGSPQIEIIPIDMLDFKQAKLTDEELHRNVYWSYGQKILRAGEIIKRDNRLFGVYLSNFSCGPDSFLMPFFKDIMGDKPCLQLEIDEHSADAGVVTRIEAFLESLKNYRGQKAEDGGQKTKRSGVPPCGTEDRGQKTENRKRKLYIPYMGDAAYGMAACFRQYGQPAEVMPMADEAALMRGRAYTTGKECLPCAITSGEMLKVLDSGVAPSNAAFFMPGGAGPCRFGLYHCMHDLVLKHAGAAEAKVIAPNQDCDFYKELVQDFEGGKKRFFTKDAWTSMVGLDLLHKVILKLRPFAVEPKEAQRVYDKCVQRWVAQVEKSCKVSDMVAISESIGDDLGKVELDDNVRKPKIGIVGEIYVRSHRFANRDIIGRLEELGAACDLASLAEWIYYTNFTRGKMARRRGLIKSLFANMVENFFQHRIEKAIAKPLEKRFGRLAELPVEHTIELAKPYLDASFEGEAVLSIGKIVEYHKDGFSGVVNVMPFTCMPSTIVSTQTRQLSGDCDEMPILNLSFDGQEDATMTTRLEAFVEQVGARNKVGAAEMAAT